MINVENVYETTERVGINPAQCQWAPLYFPLIKVNLSPLSQVHDSSHQKLQGCCSSVARVLSRTRAGARPVLVVVFYLAQVSLL